MTFQKKKQEEVYSVNKINELLRLPDNKRCFDCSKMSPSFVNMTIQTFICLRCSGLVREVGHRVKSVSSIFSIPEITGLELGGNSIGKRIWLHHYSQHYELPVLEEDTDVRIIMRQKYYENKWVNKSLLMDQNERIKKAIEETLSKEYNDPLLPKITTKKLNISSSPSTFILPPPPSSPTKILPIKQQQHRSLDVLVTPNDDDIPLGLMMGMPQKVNSILPNQIPPSPISPTNPTLTYDQKIEPLTPTNPTLIYDQKIEPLLPSPTQQTTSSIQSLDPFTALCDLNF
ncbi:hypothetical protein BJ944DRAFT_250884 [Cunninghamella echinulata]|nr:hypothetical protein BJ944DRAFT_250884 [Cunninghamella echinulata]